MKKIKESESETCQSEDNMKTQHIKVNESINDNCGTLEKQRCVRATIEKTHYNRSTIAIKVRNIVNGECTLNVDMYFSVHCAYGLHSHCH